jgi:signal transduction protein with GAF and PtsI domain
MECQECLSFFETIGNAFNSPIETKELFRLIADTLVKNFKIDACAIWLLSRDRRTLDDVASSGLSQKFLSKGPLDSERSVAEALDGKIVSITDCTNDPRIQYRAAFAEEGIVSLLAVPLAARGQVIGVLRLYSKRGMEFSQQEKDVLKVAASFCACAVLHSMFQKILRDVSETVRTSLVLDDVLQGIVKVITEDLRAKGCLIWLLHPDTKRLELKASYGLSQPYLESGPRDTAKAATEIIEGKAVAIYDAAEYLEYPEQARREGVGSLLSVPLMIYGRSIGVLRVYTYKPYEFSEDEINLMAVVGEQCALVIRHAQLYGGMKESYDALMTDFHRWFDQFYGPGGLTRQNRSGDRFPAARSSLTAAVRAGLASRTMWLLLLERQIDREAGAPARLALDRDRAAVLLRHGLDDGETEPGAVGGVAAGIR